MPPLVKIMSTIATYRTAIDSQVDQAKFSGTDEQDKAIAKAMAHHSRNKPLTVVEDIAGADTYKYDLSDMALWDDDFSVISQVEYPVDDTDESKNDLDGDDWRIYRDPTNGLELHFLTDSPATGESARVTYTAQYTCTISGCTVPGADEVAVQSLAAGFFCDILAAAHAQNQDSSIAADAVDQQSKRREYAAQAKAFKAEYYDHLGIKPGQPKPASVVQDQDVNLSSGRDRLTHPRRWR